MLCHLEVEPEGSLKDIWAKPLIAQMRELRPSDVN